mmetsp:Transcript_24682/g.76105  ORF Transcript_24682/g.76105 Transcript_24682/m.76105 type:complete len:205 (+) Transcript_24682:459-1073(+)
MKLCIALVLGAASAAADWHKTDSPSKDCTWVADDSKARCGISRGDKGARGADGTYASDMCPACAQTPMFQVTRSAVLNAKPEEVWDLVGGFQSLPDWHPLISSSTPGMLGDVETRRLGLVPVPDGVSYEREIGRDTMSYGYEVFTIPLPFTNYRSVIAVTPSEKGKAVFVWTSTFAETEPGAAGTVGAIYEAGIDALKEKFGEA